MIEALYHGTTTKAWERIRAEGIDGPSYWGTLQEVLPYATGGVLIRMPIERFDPEGLKPNNLLTETMDDGTPTPETWTESVHQLGSARYDYRILVTDDDLVEF